MSNTATNGATAVRAAALREDAAQVCAAFPVAMHTPPLEFGRTLVRTGVRFGKRKQKAHFGKGGVPKGAVLNSDTTGLCLDRGHPTRRLRSTPSHIRRLNSGVRSEMNSSAFLASRIAKHQ